MAKVMMNIRTPQPQAPSVEEVKQMFGLQDVDIDSDFGVIEIDPDDHLYTIRVEDGAAARLGGPASPSWDATGPFSDPKIQPFGPPTKSKY